VSKAVVVPYVIGLQIVWDKEIVLNVMVDFILEDMVYVLVHVVLLVLRTNNVMEH